MPRALAHLEFLLNALLQDFGSLAVLHLHFPLLRQDPGFLIGQSLPEFLGDLCLLLSPSKRRPAGKKLVWEIEGPHSRISNKNSGQYFLLYQNDKCLKSTQLYVGKGGENIDTLL